jgi:hypothetical protein
MGYSLIAPSHADTPIPPPQDGKQYPVTEACVAPCNCILRSTLGALSRWAAAGILPDTLFLLNVADVAVCRDDPWGRT